MSFGVNSYVVDLDYARGVFGSGNDEVLQLVEKKCTARLAHDTGLARAVRLLITGGSGIAEIGDYVLSASCLVFEALSVHEAFDAPLGIDWRDESDSGLFELGVDAIEFSRFGGFPNLTLPGGWVLDQEYGEWTHEQCVAAVAQWENTTEVQREELDDAVLDAVEMGIELAMAAARTPGHGVAGFFHM